MTWKEADMGYYETHSQHSFGESSESTKGLTSQWTSALWFENRTHDNANMKQECWSLNCEIQN
jgi:hypothetical protein